MNKLTPKEALTAHAIGGCVVTMIRWGVMAAIITAVAYIVYTWLSG